MGQDESYSLALNPFFWTLWILGHLIFFPLSFLLGFFFIHLFSFIDNLLPEIIASGLGYILWGIIIGGIIGLLQWLLLRSKLPLPFGWIWNSVLGIGLGEALVVIILLILKMDRNVDVELSYGWIIWTAVYFTGGFIAGLLQARTLSKFSSAASRWILGSALSWGLGTFIWAATIRYIYSEMYVILIGGAIIGITSLFFLRNIAQSKK